MADNLPEPSVQLSDRGYGHGLARAAKILTNTSMRPAHKPIVERLRRPIHGRRVLPLLPVLLNVDYPAQRPPVIHPRFISGLRK